MPVLRRLRSVLALGLGWPAAPHPHRASFVADQQRGQRPTRSSGLCVTSRRKKAHLKAVLVGSPWPARRS